MNFVAKENLRMPDYNECVDTEGISLASTQNDPALQCQRDFVAELFIAHYTSLHRFLRRTVRYDEAAELAQEAYFRLLRQGGALRQEPAARALLFQTATNLARDHHRRRRSHRAEQHVQIDVEEIAEDRLGPEEQLLKAQVLSAIEHAIAELAADTRKVLSLRLFHDLSYAEIAQRMNLSTRTVSRRMAEALERLSIAYETA
jgi:RNA polymerase sigma factor (sigma-70 family)